jgi:hypothetical protein
LIGVEAGLSQVHRNPKEDKHVLSMIHMFSGVLTSSSEPLHLGFEPDTPVLEYGFQDSRANLFKNFDNQFSINISLHNVNFASPERDIESRIQ